MAKAWLINAAKREVREVAWENVRDMHDLIGGYIEAAARLPNDDVLYVDEEGLLKQQTDFFLFALRPDQPLCGNGLIVGPETYDEEGEFVRTEDPATPVEVIRRMVRFVDRAWVESWGRANASEPASYVTTLGPGGPQTEVIARWGQVIADVPKPPEPEEPAP